MLVVVPGLVIEEGGIKEGEDVDLEEILAANKEKGKKIQKIR